jgi:oxygen-independent coproporphyrinogen-3 oxidase
MDSLYSSRSFAQETDERGETSPAAAYIHIPFCRRRCFYCDFPIAVVGDKPPTGTGDRINGSNSGTIAQYVKVLRQEIRQSPSWGIPLQTVFLGGGTPSLLSVVQLEAILAELERQFGIASNAEISMEIDPATFDLAQVKGYKAAGINRVSLGVQAFQAELLQAAGRSHTVDDILVAVDLVRAAGLTNISLDLISGLPHQTLSQWEESLDRAIALAPTHISCYDLIVEAGTPFSRQYSPGEKPLPSDELTAEMYRTSQRLLTTHGFEHYEISNYAKPGYQCRHNRVYWENRPFYGFGMGATSYLNGDRFARPRKTWEYSAWVRQEQQQTAAQQANVAKKQGNQGGDLPERLMLGLRLAEGVAVADLRATFEEAAIARLCECLQPYVEMGWVTIAPEETNLSPAAERLKLTDPEGFLFSNVVLTTIFEAFEDSAGRS